MSQPERERLSDLMDDELDAAAMPPVLDLLCADADLRGCWSRYHMIGDALRGEPLSVQAASIAERVGRALPEGAQVIALAPTRRPRNRAPAVGFALAASAALVAVLLSSGVLTTGLDAPPVQLAERPPAAPAPLPEAVAVAAVEQAPAVAVAPVRKDALEPRQTDAPPPVTVVDSSVLLEALDPAHEWSEAAGLYVDNTGTHWNLKGPAVEGKLNDYLLNHQQYAPSSRMNTTPSLVSFVSYDARH